MSSVKLISFKSNYFLFIWWRYSSPPQAKSLHGGVRCSHSAHLTQPCCDFLILNTNHQTSKYSKCPECKLVNDLLSILSLINFWLLKAFLSISASAVRKCVPDYLFKAIISRKKKIWFLQGSTHLHDQNMLDTTFSFILWKINTWNIQYKIMNFNYSAQIVHIRVKN